MQHSKIVPAPQDEGSPFDQIRHLDEYGREYWTGRDLQPLMGYRRYENLAPAIERAKATARNQGVDLDENFLRSQENPSERGGRPREDYRLTRFAAYLVSMNGDPNKPEVAAAQAYFATRTREAELGALTQAEIRDTALARAREMVDYRTFRDMMASNAPDYEPSSKATGIFFGEMQNRLYRYLTGMDDDGIKASRELYHWPGREEGKPEPGPKSRHRKVAKNYLTVGELNKLDRLVARLCLRAQDIAEDGMSLTMGQWSELVDDDLSVLTRRVAA